jgi:polar amino acid transport system ATP-binding protein
VRRRDQPAAMPDPAPSDGPLLSIRNLRKSFGANLVLDDVSLDVDRGDCVVLIGASGSGKSTLLRCVNLLEVVDDGVITLAGVDVTDPRVDADRVRSRVGIVFQAFNLFPHLSVLANVTLSPVKVHGLPRAEAEERALAMLERVGLSDKAAAKPDELSGGQQQRVAIARALVNSPVLMLLDEVTSALDPELVGEVLSLLRELKDEGMTMLIATHEMGFARQVADTVCFLDGGRLLEVGPPEQLLADPQQPRTRQFLSRIIEAGRL